MHLINAVKIFLIAAGLLIITSDTCRIATADSAGGGMKPSAILGKANFLPTADHPVGWRGDGTGRYPGATPPTSWSRTVMNGRPESSGILWMTPVPAGASSPIVVGDRIYFGFDPYGLICISKTDGRILWYRTHNFYEVMPEAQRKTIDEQAMPLYAKIKEHLYAEMKRMSDSVSPAGFPADKRFMDWPWAQQVNEQQKQLDALVRDVDREAYKANKDYWEFASATPASDGKYVYMWFSNRIAVCYDLDGKRQWVTINPAPEKQGGEHGRHSSPVLVGDKFIVEYNNNIIAFDRKTGKLAWLSKMIDNNNDQQYGSIIPASAAGLPCVVSNNGEAFRAADGERCWGKFKGFSGTADTAIAEPDHIFIYDHDGLSQILMPKTPGPDAQLSVEKSLKIHEAGGADFPTSSPLFVNGIVYLVGNKGMFRAFDCATGNALYEKQLPLDPHIEYVFFPGYAASPALAGKYIYVLDNQGGTAVIEAGRTYKQIAINKIETIEKKNRDKDGKEANVFEQTVSSPVFDGKLMFLRGQQYLYCIGSR